METIGLYVLVPAVLYAVIWLLTSARKIARGHRYRPGQEWPYEPMWWTGNPDGVGAVSHRETTAAAIPTTARGGARGSW